MFTVYSKPACPQCDQAKALLAATSTPYREIVVDVGQPKSSDREYVSRDELLARFPGVRMLPLITTGDTPVGGVAELRSLLR